MKKTVRIVLIVIGILFVINMILGQTGVLKMYNNPTTANEPGIKLNSKTFVSNLTDYENGDFICYKYNEEMFGEHIRVHRLVGKSGDVVKIRNGILYRNDVNIDENMELKHFYVLTQNEFQKLLDKKLVEREDIAFRSIKKITIPLIDKVAEQNVLSSNIKLEPKNQENKMIKEIYHESWNTDNFGPLKISKNKCFVIGDNRHNSEDSRYIGLINETDIIGTVLW